MNDMGDRMLKRRHFEECPICKATYVMPYGLSNHLVKTHNMRMTESGLVLRSVPLKKRRYSLKDRQKISVAASNRLRNEHKFLSSCIQCKEMFIAPFGIRHHRTRAPDWRCRDRRYIPQPSIIA